MTPNHTLLYSQIMLCLAIIRKASTYTRSEQIQRPTLRQKCGVRDLELLSPQSDVSNNPAPQGSGTTEEVKVKRLEEPGGHQRIKAFYTQ